MVGPVSEDTRILVGGYGPTERLAVGCLGAVTLVASACCLLGISDNHSSWIRNFGYISMFRIVAIICLFVLDWRLLGGCTRLGPQGDQFTSISDGEFNVALGMVAANGRCEWTRTMYSALVVMNLIISTFGTLHVFHFCSLVDTCPTYQIAISEAVPISIYTGFANYTYNDLPKHNSRESTRPAASPSGMIGRV